LRYCVDRKISKEGELATREGNCVRGEQLVKVETGIVVGIGVDLRIGLRSWVGLDQLFYVRGIKAHHLSMVEIVISE
jgi:hypothetical protein